MIDVHNKSNRTYTSPSGVPIEAHSTASLPDDEAARLMKNYPREIVSIDSMRASGSASVTDKRVSELEANNSELKKQLDSVPKNVKEGAEKLAILTKQLDEATAKITALESAIEESVAQIKALTAENESLKNPDPAA